MELSGIKVGRRSETQLDVLLERASSSSLTYDHVGSTWLGGSVAGRSDHTFSSEVEADLAAVRRALQRWAAHDGIGRIHPAHAPLVVDNSQLVVASLGPFEMAVPTRVVKVVDEPGRFGFSYGTLEGHAEVGEELFVAEVIDDRRTRLTVRVQAAPATRLARLGRPVVTLLQRAAAHRYLAAWAAASRGVDPDGPRQG